MVSSHSAMTYASKRQGFHTHLHQTFVENQSSTGGSVHEFLVQIFVLRVDIKCQRFFPIVDELNGLWGWINVDDWKNGTKNFFLHYLVLWGHINHKTQFNVSRGTIRVPTFKKRTKLSDFLVILKQSIMLLTISNFPLGVAHQLD